MCGVRCWASFLSPTYGWHNGTIWHWNRLFIGFDDNGLAHWRVEQRVMPAGPSIIDMIANAAFYFGAVRMLARQDLPPESPLFRLTADSLNHQRHLLPVHEWPI